MMLLSFTSIFLFIFLIVFYHAITFVHGVLIRRRALRLLPGPAPSSFHSGSLDKVFHPDDGLSLQAEYTDKVGGVWKVLGPFGDPQIYLSDPRGLESILLKQAEKFEEPIALLRQHRVFFGDGVGSATGKKHKKQRRRIGPSLTVNSLRKMTPGFYVIAHELREVLLTLTQKDEPEINIDKYISRAALEFIARVGMGHSFGKLDVNMFDVENIHPYLAAAADLSPQISRVPQILLDTLHPFTSIGTPALRQFLASLVPVPAIKEIKRILEVMDNTVHEIFDLRKASLSSYALEIENDKEERKPNIISDLLNENKQVSPSDRLSDAEILGQINSLIFAAHDTTSGAISRTIHVLALHQDVQTKLRVEIIEAQKRKAISLNEIPNRANESQQSQINLSYDELHALPYFDAVCREILRLYPPVATMPRIAKEDALIPLEYPITTHTRGEPSTHMSYLAIPRGTKIHVDVNGSNQDARTWGEGARVFCPDRWLAPAEPDSQDIIRTVSDGNIVNANIDRSKGGMVVTDGGIRSGVRIPGVWANLMTFFGGPRSCMGMRFSLLEMKIVLSILLPTFRFSPSQSTLQVSWQNLGMMAPHVKDDPGNIHRLPITVSRVRKT